MAVRTTADAVAEVIQVNTDLWNDNLMTTASALVDRLAAVISSDTSSPNYLPSGTLTHIETYIAAHLYALLDPQASEEQVGRASSKYMGTFGMGLKSTYWGQTALLLDTTGQLESMSQGKLVSVSWLGKETPDDDTSSS